MPGLCKCGDEQSDHIEGKGLCENCKCTMFETVNESEGGGFDPRIGIGKWTDNDPANWEKVGYMTNHVTPRKMLIANSNGEVIGLVDLNELQKVAIGQILMTEIRRPEGEQEVSI